MKPVYVLARARDSLSHVVTAELAQLPGQPAVPRIVYLMKSDAALRRFLNRNSTVRVSDHGLNQSPAVTSRQLMSAFNPPEYDNGDLASMESLVCSFNKPGDVRGLQKYIKNLGAKSSLLLLNTDKSYVDSMKRLVWNSYDGEQTRPEIYQCISSFRTWSYTDFQSGVIGEGSLQIARVPRDSTQESYQYDLSQHFEESSVLKQIAQTRRLNPVFLKYADFVLAQYEQMIVKTAVGSLTALHDCTNGELLDLEYTYTMLGYVVDDCLRVVRKVEGFNLSASRDKVALSKHRLLDLCLALLKTTRAESSILRQQVQLWNKNEVASTTGYFAYLARQERVAAPHINMLNKILEDRVKLAQHRGESVVL